jgi:HEAT repeat protein
MRFWWRRKPKTSDTATPPEAGSAPPLPVEAPGVAPSPAPVEVAPTPATPATEEAARAAVVAGDWLRVRAMGPVALFPLRDAVVYGRVEVRSAAAEALGALQDKRALDALSGRLEDPAWEVRVAAVRGLATSRLPEAVPLILRALTDRGPDVRAAAATALGASGDTGHGEPLKTALRDMSALVRARAASAIGALGSPRGMSALRAALQDRDPDVRREAADALGHLGWRPADATEQAQVAIACGRWDEAAALGAPALPALLSAAHHEDELTRARAVEALAATGQSRAGTPILAALRDPSPEVRAAAARSLGRLRPAGAARALVEHLGDSDIMVVAAVKEAVVSFGSSACGPLALAVRSSFDERVRRSSAEALGRVGDARAVDVLVQALRDPDHELRWQSANALGLIRDGRAATPLLHALADPDMFVVTAATQALLELGRAAIPALIVGMADTSADVRQIAEVTLGRIDPAWMRTLEAQTAAPQLLEYLRVLGGDEEMRDRLQELVRTINPALLDLKRAPGPPPEHAALLAAVASGDKVAIAAALDDAAALGPEAEGLVPVLDDLLVASEDKILRRKASAAYRKVTGRNPPRR